MRDLLYGALCALLTTAVSCGGGDPPGGGNGNGDGGDETDGTTGNGGTDGYVPNPSNPLIDVISGPWEVTLLTIYGEPYEDSFRTWANVFPEDPDCSQSLRERRNIGDLTSIGPPGDACIYWTTIPPDWSILDGMRLRYERPSSLQTGDILDGGRRIEMTVTFTNGDPPSTFELVKLE